MSKQAEGVDMRLILLAIVGLMFGGCAMTRQELRPSDTGRFSEEERHLIAADDALVPLPLVQNTSETNTALLRREALPVDPSEPALPLLLARMRATMEQEQGVGIAAPQVGVARRVIWVQRLDIQPDMPFQACLNPEFLSFSDELETDWEGCLSVTGGFGEVSRPLSVTVRCQALDGTWREERISGRTARIFQHEVDHLDGILFTDRMPQPVALTPKEEYRAMRERMREEASRTEPQTNDDETSPSLD